MSVLSTSSSQSFNPTTVCRKRAAQAGGTRPAVLIVSADRKSASTLSDLFGLEGFACLEATGGAAAEELLATRQVALIVIDGRLNGAGAMGACTRLAGMQAAPIIILSDDFEVTDRIIALEVGADDLLSRQFDKRELIAKARALIRRSGRRKSRGGMQAVLHLRSRQLVGVNGAQVSLQPSVFALLWLFASRPGQLITADVAGDVLGLMFSNVHFRTSIARVRRRLASVGIDPGCLASVRSEGYALDPRVAFDLRSEGSQRAGRAEAGLRETIVEHRQ